MRLTYEEVSAVLSETAKDDYAIARAIEAAVLAKLSSGQDYTWRFTGLGGLARHMTDEKYKKQPPEVQKWYEPAQQPLSEAYEKGWREAAKWASREDLFCDIGSLAYLKGMAEHGIKEKP
jgi:hypothetical protein